MLKLYSIGEDVSVLESILRRLGFYSGEINHYFDNKTRIAVKNFQNEFGLKVDGIVGKKTWAKLIEVNPLTYLFIHCSATEEGKRYTDKDILYWHTAPKPKGRGWLKSGYSKVFGIDGEEWTLRNYDEDKWVEPTEITNGARGYNKISRHICYIGGVDKEKNPKDTRTKDQKNLIEKEVKKYIERYPDIVVVGHNQVSEKNCPSFDVPSYLRSIGVSENNIYIK